MKKHVTLTIIMCLVFVSLMVLQVSAGARSYYHGCYACSETVVARCTGFISSTDNLSHKYKTILGLGGYTCIYNEIVHGTRETCQANSAHVNIGDNMHYHEGHTYDDVGKNICGMKDSTPCSLNSIAYTSN
ncbi:MAG: hypothetical protein IJ325_08450 [Clostridia bacterium]|nr:hypothetical protein [Clostridia bacterium]